MSTEFVFFLLIVIAILLSVIIRIMVSNIEEEMKNLYYKIDKANSTLDILEKKVDRIENVRLLTEDKIRKNIEKFCKDMDGREDEL